MPGHVFVVRGDVRRIACDAWLMPCDRRARNPEFLPDHLRDFADWPEPPADFHHSGRRVLPIPAWPADEPRPWLVHVGGRPGAPRDWYVEGLRQALAVIVPDVRSRAPRNRREKPLVALPLLGTGGGAWSELGAAVRALLPVLSETAQREDVDFALVALGAMSFAAMQHERAQLPGVWACLSSDLQADAERLVGPLSARRLSLFLGAGASVGAGLPLWSGLLDSLAEGLGVPRDDARRIRDRLGELEFATYLSRQLGDPSRLSQAVAAIFSTPARRWYYSLAQGLLAALPIRETVTTNYDQLFEAAWDAASAEPISKTSFAPTLRTSIIPHRLRPDADRWLMKMHGCLSQPETIVLTRESYIRYSEQWAALEGILQATLLTRHMLFVGFSFADDNFLRIVDAVRRIVRPRGTSAEPPHAPYGTALMLTDDSVLRSLHEPELRWTTFGGALAGRDESPVVLAPAARRLEIFLDYLASQTRESSHLLDDRFSDVLDAEEQSLKALLGPLVQAARSRPDHAVWGRVRGWLRGLGAEGV
ncbi:MAG TPA: SIR2 family protein [Pirellulales bacterium]